MTKQVDNLTEFLQELNTNPRMQESVREAAQGAGDNDISHVLVKHAETAGYDIDAGDMDTLVQEVRQLDNDSELSDEALDQVSGGSIIATAAVIIGGSIAGFLASAIGGVIKDKA
ncbi:MAG: Nif11-like leader peptide family RiPP precursor [Marinobacter sp.]